MIDFSRNSFDSFFKLLAGNASNRVILPERDAVCGIDGNGPSESVPKPYSLPLLILLLSSDCSSSVSRIALVFTLIRPSNFYGDFLEVKDDTSDIF